MTTGVCCASVNRSGKAVQCPFFFEGGAKGCFADFMQALRSRFSISKDIESTTALLVQWILLY
jgi:hypothetical protein